jgi:hypothetical protein
MPTRSYVQVAADGVGKKVANVAVTEPTAPDTSGNATADTTTYQQLVHRRRQARRLDVTSDEITAARRDPRDVAPHPRSVDRLGEPMEAR